MTSSAEEREPSGTGVKRVRAKPTNVSQSLGRLTHIKTRTVIWLRTIEKLQPKDAPISAALHDVPASVMLNTGMGYKVGIGHATNHQAEQSDQAASQEVGNHPLEQPTLRTPLAHWGAHTPIAHTCSFCGLRAHADSMHVSYNYMLPLPYTVSCAACVSLCVKT